MAIRSKFFTKLTSKVKAFQAKRPHRSFRRTRRRDALKPLVLPGYISFTKKVMTVFWKYRRQLFSLAFLYAILYAVLVGIASQDSYTSLLNTLQEAGEEVFQGNWNELGAAGIVFMTLSTVGLGEAPTEAQQIYAIILILLSWMTTVWLLRNLLAKRKVSLRDGLYSASAPLVATGVIALVFIVQLIPVGIAMLGYSAATSTGLLLGGVEAMLFWVAAGTLGLLSLFWLTSTFFAMIIVTLPGTYPFKALSIAGDMVLGRRVKILFRLLWMLLVVVVCWAAILIPIILVDMWLKGIWEQITWLPIVPLAILLLSSLTSVWVSSYIYLLYRAVVDEDARHA